MVSIALRISVTFDLPCSHEGLSTGHFTHVIHLPGPPAFRMKQRKAENGLGTRLVYPQVTFCARFRRIPRKLLHEKFLLKYKTIGGTHVLALSVQVLELFCFSYLHPDLAGTSVIGMCTEVFDCSQRTTSQVSVSCRGGEPLDASAHDLCVCRTTKSCHLVNIVTADLCKM